MRWTLPLAALLVTAIAQAGDAPAPAAAPATGRHSIDANNDGIVTREEAAAHQRLAAQFDTVDTNKDGQLDAAEMQAHREAMHEQMRAHAEQRWTAADTDGDGAVSLAEAKVAMPGVAERFDKFDGNGDGKVSRDEMHNFRMRKQDGKGRSEQL